MPNNIVIGLNFLAAIEDRPLSELSLTGVNVIFSGSDGGAPISYKPGRSINSLMAIEAGKSYLLNSSQVKDLTASFSRQVTIGGIAELIPLLNITDIGTTTAHAEWNAISGATAYNLRRSTSDNFPGSVSLYSGNLLEFSDTGLAGGTDYYYFIKIPKPAFPTFTGKTYSICGDSFVELGLIQPAIEAVGLTSVYEDGKGGSCLATGTELKNNDSVSRPSIYSRIATMFAENSDFFFANGGQNDWASYVTSGGMGQTPLGTINSTDTTTLYGALNGIVAMWNAYKATHPNAVFIFITRAISSNATPTDDFYDYDNQTVYQDIPYKVMVKAGIPCINPFLFSGINFSNLLANASDYVHITGAPYGTCITNFLNAPYVADRIKITTVSATAAPAVSSSGTASGTVGTAFNYQITGSNTPTSYAATGLPSGLSINTTTGAITGTPTTAATSTITISATNATGTGTKTLTLTVGASGIYHNSLFTGSNGTGLPSYTPNTGAGWVNRAGTWEIQSNRATTLSIPGGGNAIATTNVGHSDGTITMVGKSLSSSVDLQMWLRYTSNNDSIVLEIGNASVDVYNIVSGVVSPVGTTALISRGATEHTYEAILNGTSLTVKFDGVALTGLTAITLPTIQTGQDFGFGTAGAGSAGTGSIDSFLAAA